MVDLPRTIDAVLVLPGIMGSQLETPSGQTLWGLDPARLAGTWLSDAAFAALQVTAEDLTHPGRRVVATKPLHRPGWMPFLGGLEPYAELLRDLRSVVLDGRAIATHAYDWRLPVAMHVSGLVDACRSHLQRWQDLLRRNHPEVDHSAARVALVAHSMGGLLARMASHELAGERTISRVITLGTPYLGSVKAVEMLVTGEGMPFPTPTRAARDLARSCPGVFDLLPRYDCLAATNGAPERPLAARDLAAMCSGSGAARIEELAEQAAERFEAARSALLAQQPRPLHYLVGGRQPTLQSVVLDAGLADFRRTIGGVDYSGDGTVPHSAALLDWAEDYPLAQQHGALQKGAGVYFVQQKLLRKPVLETLSDREVGLDVPDIVSADGPPEARVETLEVDPTTLAVTSTELESGASTSWSLSRQEGNISVYVARYGIEPGLHRVVVRGAGEDVTAIVLATRTQACALG